MSKASKSIPVFRILVPLYVCLALLFAVLIKQGNVQLLESAGYIADIQSKLLWGVLIFASIVGTIVITAFFMVAFRYREGKNSRYEPDWTAGVKLQALGWGIPMLAIAGISCIVWITAHLVDPYRPIASLQPPITIQVVALQWKWLFLYPYDHIATVNTLEIPVNTPVAFQLTADAPMNSFWIPRLSGQIYAMTGMVTQLHIEADQPGTYAGSPAEISGAGFAGMTFNVKAVSASQYAAWKVAAAESPQSLDYTMYNLLAKPSSYVTPALYQLHDQNLFEAVVMKFMAPGTDVSTLQVKGSAL